MVVFVAEYKGTDMDNILGVFTDIEKAKETIYKDYIETRFDYIPDVEEIEDNHIYIAEKGMWYDEWCIVETELK